MPKGLGYFLLIVSFIFGVSIGLYGGFDKNDINEKESNNSAQIIPVQDAVIKKVQSEMREANSSGDDIIVETVKVEEKISPYAQLVIKKKFLKCNHSTINMIDVPKELVNLPQKDVEEKYTGWNIEEFSAEKVVLSREIDANCDEHFVLKEKEGNIAVYNELTDDKMNLIEVLSVSVDLLSDSDKNDLKNGIRVFGKEELNSLIEDYNS